MYSVKSAYTLIQESKTYQQVDGNTKFWKCLWNLKIPPKVKNFMWRAVTNCLPTKDLLRVKKVNVDALCPLCNTTPESILHCLVTCTYAQSCWTAFNVTIDPTAQTQFLQWMITAMDVWSIQQKEMGVMLCWSVWKSRYDLVWKQRGMEISEVLALARVVLSEWQEAQDKHFDKSWSLLAPDDGNEHWTLPKINNIKVNTDAAIFQDDNCYSYAFAARNHKGEFIHAQSRCKPGHIAPESAEALGISEALSWMKEKHMAGVIVESDCLVAVQAIRGSAQLLSYFGRIVGQCRVLLEELKHKDVILRFVKWSANNLAHSLASCSYSIADRVWEPGVAYSDLSHVLANDLKQ